jgi:hypothetical protein
MQRARSLEWTVGEALVLRRFALAVLGGVSPDPATLRAARRCAPRSWSVFLDVEACGLPLLTRLTDRGELAILGEDAREPLRRCAEAEERRVRAARAQIATLETVARQLGVTAVLMKGAGHLAAGCEPLDLIDVDLLVGTTHAEPMWAALRALDHRPVADVPAGDVDDVESNHMPRLVGPSGMPVEIHRRAVYGADRYGADAEVRTLPGYSALRRAVGPATLRSTLWHAVHQHPHRYGRLRDVLLVAALYESLTPGERRAGDPTLASPAVPESQRMLALARAVGRGAPIADDEACRRMAARTYAMVLGEDAWMRRVAPVMDVFAFIGFERPRQGAARIAEYVGARQSPASRWYSTRVARLSPSLASGSAILCRTLPRVWASAVAIAAAPRAVRRAGRRVGIADVLLRGAESPD